MGLAGRKLGQRRGWLVALALLHVLPFAIRPSLIGGDEPHYALMSHSMAVDRDVDVTNNYVEVQKGSRAAGKRRAGSSLIPHVRRIGDSEVFAHPLGLPLLTAPFLAAKERLMPGAAPDLILGLLTLGITFAAVLAGWQLLERYLNSRAHAAFIAFGTYFSTPLWFYSRTFFTEPFIWSWLVLGIACLAANQALLAGFFLALALAMKETALLLVVPVLATVALIQGFKTAAMAAIGPVVFGAMFVVKNLMILGTPFSTFHPFRFGDPLRGALGLVLDSRHGLLWFAPLVTLAIVGWLIPSRNTLDRFLRLGSLSAFLAYFALTAAWADWRGGVSFGPRLMIPALPALTIPLARLLMHPQRRRLIVLYAVFFLAGFVVQWGAAWDPFGAFWAISVRDLILDDLVATVAGLFVGIGLICLAWSASSGAACSGRAGSTST